MTFEEGIKLNNFKEHRKIILSNLKDANLELTKILAERDILEVAVNKIKKNLLSESEKVSLLRGIAVEISRTIDNQILEIEQNKKLHKEEITSFVYNVEILKDVETQLKAKINSLGKELELLVEKTNLQKNSIDKVIESKYIIKAELDNDIVNLDNTRHELFLEITELEHKKNNEIKDLDKSISKAREDYELVLQKVNDEREKVKLPLESLDAREKEIERKEHNLQILTMRFKKEFKKLHPDLEPKI